MFSTFHPSTFKILTGIPTGKRPLQKPKLRWEQNIRIDVKEMRINAKNWDKSAQERDYWRALANAALSPRVP